MAKICKLVQESDVKFYRLKKGIKLKQLEKYGYKAFKNYYVKKSYNTEEMICISKKWIALFDKFGYEYDIHESITHDEELGDIYDDKGKYYISDLIKDGLVEKW